MNQKEKTMFKITGLNLINFLTFLLLFVSSLRVTESMNICNKCLCENLTTNYLFDCSQRKIVDLFIEEDWNETLTVNNISSETFLDVRFDLNLIEKVTRFPSLNIQSLTFSYNKITYIENSAFTDLDNLSSIDLSHNQLDSDGLPETAFLGRFHGNDHYLPLPWQHLSLSHNNIHSIQPDLFDHLPFLKTIDLSANPLKILSGSTTQAISELRNLTVLDLANTSIKAIPEGMLHDLLRLEILDLSDNLFETVPHELQNSHNLSILLLDGNKFKVLDNDSFPGLQNLSELHVSHMPTLKAIEFGAFGHLKNLRILKCSNNPKLSQLHDGAFLGITDDDPEGWPIREMYLNDNALPNLRKPLANWALIDILDIQNNPFRCDCDIQWLAEALVPQIQSATKELVIDVTCNEPEALRGQGLVGLSLEHEQFLKCEPGSHKINGDDSTIEISNYRYKAGIAVLTIGIVLIVIVFSILGVVLLKRRAIAHALMAHQQIRYERADTDEDDYTRERHRHYQPGTEKI